MKNLLTLVAVCLLLAAGNAFAVRVETYSTSSKDSSKDVALVESEAPLSFEFQAEGTYVGKGDVRRGLLKAHL